MNPNNDHVGFPRARNKNGVIINARYAIKGETYYCPFCGLEMYRKTSHCGTDFFTKKPGTHHKHPICQQIERTGTYHSFDASNSPNDLIGRICRVPIPHGGGGGGPVFPPIIGPEEIEPGEPKNAHIKAFRSLKSIYEYGCFDQGPFDKCGNYFVSDFYIHYLWAHHFFKEKGYKLNCRIIQARFRFFDRPKQTLNFVIFNKKLDFPVSFTLNVPKTSIFNDILHQIFNISEDETTGKTVTNKRDALIASPNWVYNEVNDCYETQILTLKQVYIIPR